MDITQFLTEKKLDIAYDKSEINLKLNNLIKDCLYRCLNQSANWLIEFLKNIEINSSMILDCNIRFLEMINLFNMGNYDKVSFLSTNMDNPAERFLHYFSKYQLITKKQLLISLDDFPENDYQKQYSILSRDFLQCQTVNKMDCFDAYLMGLIQLKLNSKTEAIKHFSHSIQSNNLFWPSWHELSNIVDSFEEILKLNLPENWMMYLFLGQYFETSKADLALSLYKMMQETEIFSTNTYIQRRIAKVYYELKDIDNALKMFDKLRQNDPFCLDEMDTYSNLLYMLEKREELCALAHEFQQRDPYRPETCCIIGNYYSLCDERPKAIEYFHRALTLNPEYYQAWLHIGLEYNEMKNHSNALQAFHRASKINTKDYRVWNGFGLSYEMMEMYGHALYYYKKAEELRPTDSNILISLGVCSDALGKPYLAKTYYEKAIINGDLDGKAVFKLAKCCEHINDTTLAVLAFKQYLDKNTTQSNDVEQEVHALKYLGHYYYEIKEYQKSYSYFSKCLFHAEGAEEGRRMLFELHKYLD